MYSGQVQLGQLLLWLSTQRSARVMVSMKWVMWLESCFQSSSFIFTSARSADLAEAGSSLAAA